MFPCTTSNIKVIFSKNFDYFLTFLMFFSFYKNSVTLSISAVPSFTLNIEAYNIQCVY